MPQAPYITAILITAVLKMIRAVTSFHLIMILPSGNELLMQSPSLALHVGGAEANVAIGLAHLGHDCAMVSKIPANALGRGAVAAVRGARTSPPCVSGPVRTATRSVSVAAFPPPCRRPTTRPTAELERHFEGDGTRPG